MSALLTTSWPSTVANDGKRKILHIMPFEKFVAPFIDFVEEHFADFDQHLFFCIGDAELYPVSRRPNTLFESDFLTSRRAYFELAVQMSRAQKIILHGLFHIRVVQQICMQPWVLKKCFWVIWGWDLYSYKLAERTRDWCKREIFRKYVIKRLGHIVTFIAGDVELARQWYGARGKYHQCVMYPSNLFKKCLLPPKSHDGICVQIGNSADPDNEHFEILQMLDRYRGENLRIYAPLSYGDPLHARKVAAAGEKMFGDKFVALTEFLPLDDYRKLLEKIDIAVFNHRRQQGMGNMITLLGLGKKVYLRTDVTPWQTFESMGLKVYDNADIDLHPLDGPLMKRNQEIVERNFSEQILINQLRKIFED
jgi:dTDP-N-acetylfucosamine:lipid II N-acetylfucosaminyltransferase